MSTSTRSIPRIHHELENIEMKEFNFILTKKIQINSCTCGLDLSDTCDNYMSQKPVVKNNVCNNRTPKLIVACVGTCVCNCA